VSNILSFFGRKKKAKPDLEMAFSKDLAVWQTDGTCGTDGLHTDGKVFKTITKVMISEGVWLSIALRDE
jgi:hypothetical protein